ncbi:MAG TPA: MarR family transcriptional regulator [Polyangiaceae bacterium]|nr:MarR family transcriptional regulator [Polyangiaceae bacterium]
MASHSMDGALLTQLIVELTRARAQLDDVAQVLADPSGLTAARWHVLSAVSGAPAPAAQVARAIGLTRQAVQQTADALEAEGLIQYRANPNHKRAKLIEATAIGRQRLAAVEARQIAWANRLGKRLGRATLQSMSNGVRALMAELSRDSARRADKR